jgi:hypothetical protein
MSGQMSKQTDAERLIRYGSRFPYDAPDAWWKSSTGDPPPATDWAHRAARGVLADLRDRGGIKHALDMNVDEDTRTRIVAAIAEIIRVAYRAS